MAEHFTRFSSKKQASCWLKEQQQKDNCYLGNVCSTEQPFISYTGDKQATKDEIDIGGGKHVLACF